MLLPDVLKHYISSSLDHGGQETSKVVDTLEATFVNARAKQLSTRSSISVPSNTPRSALLALDQLFGAYSIEPTRSASTHPSLDAFRAICDVYVFDRVGAANLIEVGPSLGRLAAQPRLMAGHSCSPNLDARDQARASLMGIQVRRDHPHRDALLARARQETLRGQDLICMNVAQDCRVAKPYAYASFSLQDCNPMVLVDIMDAHRCQAMYFSLMLPIPLLIADTYQDEVNDAKWVRKGNRATCFPGRGDAGYTHSWAHLSGWMNGFDGIPVFVEVVKQFGSALLFRAVRVSHSIGSDAYPMLVSSMLSRLVLIPGTASGKSDFLTSSKHYARLVQFLHIVYDKHRDDIITEAMKRISVLTPAILIGGSAHLERWELDADRFLDVAVTAAYDVTRQRNKVANAKKIFEAGAHNAALDAQRELYAREPGIIARITAALRGEKSVVSDLSIYQRMLNFVDGGRLASDIFQSSKLEDVVITNGGAGVVPQEPPVDEYVDAPQFGPAPNPVEVDFEARRPANIRPLPRPAALHDFHNQAWVDAQQGMPERRDTRIVDGVNVADLLVDARNALAARPVNDLTRLQMRALDNVRANGNTCLDVLLLGPAGTGKSTAARRMLGRNFATIVPTNELREAAIREDRHAVVYTFDQAVASSRRLSSLDGIFIDEVYLMPLLYVITLCSLGVPVVAAGCPAQRPAQAGLGPVFEHTSVPVDHIAILNQVHRYGGDALRVVSDHALPIYRDLFPLPAAFAFESGHANTIMPQVDYIGEAMHLTAHRGNRQAALGADTVDSSQGRQEDNVYLHLFAGDVAFYAANPYAIPLAVSRARVSFTFVLHDDNLNTAAIIPDHVRGLAVRHADMFQVVGSLREALHAVPLFDVESEPAAPQPVVIAETHFSRAPLGDDFAVTEADAYDADMPGSIEVALQYLQPEPPRPNDMIETLEEVHLHELGAKVVVSSEQPTPPSEFIEPTTLHHRGYPFTNDDVVSSIVAVFDRYTKPRNVPVDLPKATELAAQAFNNWVTAFIDPRACVSVPEASELVADWFSKKTVSQISMVLNAVSRHDSSKVFMAEYFLKKQAKPKAGVFGHTLEKGQGILATDKALNAITCPFTTAAAKTMQAAFKPGVLYDQGFTATELDAAVFTALGPGPHPCMSIDLSQQDSSHSLIHRILIGLVLDFLGFGNDVIGLYLATREARKVKGIKLHVSFNVFERLFSGEPGTALFNFIMSTATTASCFDLSNMRLFLGKGDDNTVVPPPPRRPTARSFIYDTGVIQKIEYVPYLDFANRIFVSSGRSFQDPARTLMKFTSRLTGRVNSEDEFKAHNDLNIKPKIHEVDELAHYLAIKHKIPHYAASDITDAAVALNKADVYFAHLRPSKIPAARLPTMRKCCNLDVVFEDARDRCGPAALAFILDMPEADVIKLFNQHRDSHGADVNSLLADKASDEERPYHVSVHELFTIGQKLGYNIGRSHQDLALHICRGHVSVVRNVGTRQISRPIQELATMVLGSTTRSAVWWFYAIIGLVFRIAGVCLTLFLFFMASPRFIDYVYACLANLVLMWVNLGHVLILTSPVLLCLLYACPDLRNANFLFEFLVSTGLVQGCADLGNAQGLMLAVHKRKMDEWAAQQQEEFRRRHAEREQEWADHESRQRAYQEEWARSDKERQQQREQWWEDFYREYANQGFRTDNTYRDKSRNDQPRNKQEEEIQYCIKTTKADKKYWRRCHPDKLQARHDKQCIADASPLLRSGSTVIPDSCRVAKASSFFAEAYSFSQPFFQQAWEPVFHRACAYVFRAATLFHSRLINAVCLYGVVIIICLFFMLFLTRRKWHHVVIVLCLIYALWLYFTVLCPIYLGFALELGDIAIDTVLFAVSGVPSRLADCGLVITSQAVVFDLLSVRLGLTQRSIVLSMSVECALGFCSLIRTHAIEPVTSATRTITSCPAVTTSVSLGVSGYGSLRALGDAIITGLALGLQRWVTFLDRVTLFIVLVLLELPQAVVIVLSTTRTVCLDWLSDVIFNAFLALCFAAFLISWFYRFVAELILNVVSLLRDACELLVLVVLMVAPIQVSTIILIDRNWERTYAFFESLAQFYVHVAVAVAEYDMAGAHNPMADPPLQADIDDVIFLSDAMEMLDHISMDDDRLVGQSSAVGSIPSSPSSYASRVSDDIIMASPLPSTNHSERAPSPPPPSDHPSDGPSNAGPPDDEPAEQQPDDDEPPPASDSEEFVYPPPPSTTDSVINDYLRERSSFSPYSTKDERRFLYRTMKGNTEPNPTKRAMSPGTIAAERNERASGNTQFKDLESISDFRRAALYHDVPWTDVMADPARYAFERRDSEIESHFILADIPGQNMPHQLPDDAAETIQRYTPANPHGYAIPVKPVIGARQTPLTHVDFDKAAELYGVAVASVRAHPERYPVPKRVVLPVLATKPHHFTIAAEMYNKSVEQIKRDIAAYPIPRQIRDNADMALHASHTLK